MAKDYLIKSIADIKQGETVSSSSCNVNDMCLLTSSSYQSFCQSLLLRFYFQVMNVKTEVILWLEIIGNVRQSTPPRQMFASVVEGDRFDFSCQRVVDLLAMKVQTEVYYFCISKDIISRMLMNQKGRIQKSQFFLEVITLFYCIYMHMTLIFRQQVKSLIYNNIQMSQLYLKMRELTIRNLKQRRQQIFQKSRNLLQRQQPTQKQTEQQNQSQPPQNSQQSQTSNKMQQQSKRPKTKRQKQKQEQKMRTRRYWRKVMQVSDWMIEVPSDIRQYYVAPRPDGKKCLAIFRGYRVELRDKSGCVVLECNLGSKMYDNTVIQVYYDQEEKIMVVSDLILWKKNPMNCSEFQFRNAWLISNLSLPNLAKWMELSVYWVNYAQCNEEGLQKAYYQQLPYRKQGLFFLHKDSSYIHGLNHQALIWKDHTISQYLQQQIQQSKQCSRGIGFLNKQGQVKSIDNILLFKLDRNKLDNLHRFVKFVYQRMTIQNVEGDEVIVVFDELKVIESMQYYNGPIDSISKLLYKSQLRGKMLEIKDIWRVITEQTM